MKLKIISGGQTGADLAGLWAAKLHSVPTGGMAPKGFKTLVGPKSSLNTLFGIVESKSSGYPDRTKNNVEASDLTILSASNFNSAGTKLTIRCLISANIPYISFPFVNGTQPVEIKQREPGLFPETSVEQVVNSIQRLALTRDEVVVNVAGNSTNSAEHAFEHTFVFICEVLKGLGFGSRCPSMSYLKLATLIKDDFDSIAFEQHVLPEGRA